MTFDRCLLTAFISDIEAPEVKSALLTLTRSSSDMEPRGDSASAEAPPETRTRTWAPPLPAVAAHSRAAVPALRLPGVGRGWPPLMISRLWPLSPSASIPSGITTTPPSISPESDSRAPEVMDTDALPIAMSTTRPLGQHLLTRSLVLFFTSEALSIMGSTSLSTRSL